MLQSSADNSSFLVDQRKVLVLGVVLGRVWSNQMNLHVRPWLTKLLLDVSDRHIRWQAIVVGAERVAEIICAFCKNVRTVNYIQRLTCFQQIFQALSFIPLLPPYPYFPITSSVLVCSTFITLEYVCKCRSLSFGIIFVFAGSLHGFFAVVVNVRVFPQRRTPSAFKMPWLR